MVEKEACHWSAIIGNKILRVFKRKRLMGGHIWGEGDKGGVAKKGEGSEKGGKVRQKDRYECVNMFTG